jgi:L-serine kinase (ADP)
MHILFAKVADLKPLEGYISERADWLENKIIADNKWTTPIVVDNKYGLVMDGHHRLEVSKRLCLQFVPVISCSYSDVEVYSLRDDEIVTVNQIIKNYNNKILYPNKTAKHNFNFNLTESLEVSLEKLK